MDERGIVIRNKARLVAQRHTQEEGIDYDEVFAPIAKIEAIRLFLAYASFKDFIVYQMDVKSAFLYRKIEEEAYVFQPPGFKDLDFPDKVYKVKKTLWFTSCSKSLMSSMGELTFFLGLQVKPKKEGVFITQAKYVAEILKMFGFLDVKKASTPMQNSKPLLKGKDGKKVDVHMYRSMIGSLWVNVAIDVVKVSTVKFYLLLLKIRIEQYFLMTDYSLWEVILNGDSLAPTRVIDDVLQPITPTTAEQRLARKNELKVCGTLLMALPDKHQLNINTHKDANTLMEAIEKRFGGNTKTKKVQKTLMKQQYENSTGSSFVSLDQIYDRLQKLINQLEILGRNKTDLEEQSLDDLFNSLKIYEAEVRSSFYTGTSTQNIAFVSSSNNDSTTEPISASASVSAISAKIPVSSLLNVDTLSNDVIYLFFSIHSNSPQLDNDDLKQIDADDLEEMDLKWKMAMWNVTTATRKDTLQGSVVLRQNLEKAEQERDDSKLTLEKFQTSSKNLSELLASQTNDKTGLGYNSQVFTHAMFDCHDYCTSKSDESLPPSPFYNRYQSGNRPTQANIVVTKPYSPPRRHINHSPSLKASNFPPKVTVVKAHMVNAAKSVQGKWEWKPKCPILDHVSYNTSKLQHALKDKVVIDSGCSRHMIGNMSYLSDFEELNGGYVSFGGNPKGGKIFGKEDSSAAGTDNHPPMLEESDYESWKIRIERYIKGSPAGIVMQPRDKRDEEFTDAENLKELCDIQASNILSQALPRRIFNTLNQTQSAKEIWESLELLMKGSGQTLDRRKEDLFDEYERFRANGNELIQDYFVCFHKLINDMKVTKLMIPIHHMNTKSYEEHALEKLKKQEQSSSVVDPLAYLVKTTHQQAPTHSTTTSPSQLTPALASTSSSTAQSHDDAIKQIANLLSGFQKQFPPTNNQLRNTGYRGNQNNGQGVNNKKKVICYNSRREGHVARQCKEPKHLKDSLWHQDKVMLLQANENGAVLDVEAEAFLADVECTVPLAEPLALTTTNMFQVNHEDAYDSNVDDEPNATAAFIDEHLDSDDDSIHEDYTIPYDQYLATKESQDVHTEASPIPPTAIYMLQMLTDLTTQVEGHRKVIVTRNKRNAKLKQETELLKTTLRNKEATIGSLTSETKTVLLPQYVDCVQSLLRLLPPIGIVEPTKDDDTEME
nr:hypothetical protein [Tanacetum cinerariifolium]